MKDSNYIAIDLKSFYASVECVERGLDPLTTNLVVADASRTEKTICLAVSPSLKAYGIPGRARLFEVVQRCKEVNLERQKAAPGRKFAGKSTNGPELQGDPSMELDYIIAPPQMARYMEVSSQIYQVYTEITRKIPNAKTGELEENVILSDFYLVREFSDSELRLLIDSVLFSKHIPYSQCKELVEKLEGLSNQYFLSRVKHIRTMPEDAPTNKQLFYTIETLDEAMTHGKQVEFVMNLYGLDKKLHPRLGKNGVPRRVTVNPYQIAAANGRYYLICNYEGYDNVIHCRMDRISDIRLLDTPRKPMKQVKGLENGLDLPRHMAEHIYMFAGPSVPVTFRFKKYLTGEIIDWFGKDVVFSDETEDEATARVTVNLDAMRRWALQYALHVRVLTPESLRDEVKEDIRKAAENYHCWEEKL